MLDIFLVREVIIVHLICFFLFWLLYLIYHSHTCTSVSVIKQSHIVLVHRQFVSTFICFPKPLIAAVNGPAVGISVTLLGLYDLVYAAEHVRIHEAVFALLSLT